MAGFSFGYKPVVSPKKANSFLGTWGNSQAQIKPPAAPTFPGAFGHRDPLSGLVPTGSPSAGITAYQAPTPSPSAQPGSQAPQQAAQSLPAPDYRLDPGYIANLGGIGLNYDLGLADLNRGNARGQQDLSMALANMRQDVGLQDKQSSQSLAQQLAGLQLSNTGNVRLANRSLHSQGLQSSSEHGTVLGELAQSYGLQRQGAQTSYDQGKASRAQQLAQYLSQNQISSERLKQDLQTGRETLVGQKGVDTAKEDAAALARSIADAQAHPPVGSTQPETPTAQAAAAIAKPTVDYKDSPLTTNKLGHRGIWRTHPGRPPVWIPR